MKHKQVEQFDYSLDNYLKNRIKELVKLHNKSLKSGDLESCDVYNFAILELKWIGYEIKVYKLRTIKDEQVTSIIIETTRIN